MLKKKFARIISEISNGFMTMMLTPLIAILFLPLSTQYKTIASTIYILSPILPYFVLKKMGKISDYEFTKREERPPYFTSISILFGLIFIYINTLDNSILTTISLNIFLVSSAIAGITFFWKISGHMTYSTLLFTTLLFLFPTNPNFFLLFLFTPFIAWSRIALQKHTLTQVTLGTLITLTISILIYWGF